MQQTHLSTNLKRLLFLKSLWFEEQMSNELIKRGGQPRTPAQAKLLMLLNGQARTVSSAAKHLGVSRQAVHKTLRELIEDGWLYLEVGEKRNEKIIRFTEFGQAQRHIVAASLNAIEKNITHKLGEKNTALLRTLLMQDWS